MSCCCTDGCYCNGLPCDSDSGSAGCTAYNTSVYKSGTATIAPTVPLQINFNVKAAGENPANFFNLTTDIATIPFTGNWTITTTGEVITAAAGPVFWGIQIDEGGGYNWWAISSVFPPSAAYVNLSAAVTKYLQAGDLIKIVAQQNTGFNGTINGTQRRVNCGITSSCIP